MRKAGGENQSAIFLVRDYSAKVQYTGELLFHAINRGGIGSAEQEEKQKTSPTYLEPIRNSMQKRGRGVGCSAVAQKSKGGRSVFAFSAVKRMLKNGRGKGSIRNVAYLPDSFQLNAVSLNKGAINCSKQQVKGCQQTINQRVNKSQYSEFLHFLQPNEKGDRMTSEKTTKQPQKPPRNPPTKIKKTQTKTNTATTITCECGTEIYLTHDITAMSQAIEDHVAEHLKKEHDVAKSENIRDNLIAQTFLLAADQKQPLSP